MIDTIRYSCSWKLLPEFQERVENKRKRLYGQWGQLFYDPRINWIRKDFPRKPFIIQHKTSKLVCVGDADRILVFQVSLPGLLHGCNGMLIKNNLECQLAFQKLVDTLSEISSPPDTPYLFHEVKRLDLTLNVLHPAKILIPTHRFAKHPWIKRKSITFGETSSQYNKISGVSNNGDNIKFLLYDKKLEISHGNAAADKTDSKSTRIEFQLLNTKMIRRALDLIKEIDPELPTRLENWLLTPFPIPADYHWDYWRLYSVWRALLLMTQPVKQLPKTKADTLTLIEICEANNVTLPNGMRVLDWYNSRVNKRARDEMRKKLEKHSLLWNDFSWEKELPENHPPTVVDVLSDGSEKEVPWEKQYTVDIACEHAGKFLK